MSKRTKKLRMSGGAMHARAQFQEGKHKRDMSGKFADMPGSVVPGAAGSQAAPIVPAAKADWFSAAKTSQIKGDDRIKLHVTSNPKKPGSMSAERFAHYQDGMTVADFKKAGGLPEDLAHDRKKGFVTFHDSETYGKLSTAGASPVSQINLATATGRLASIKAGAEVKAATVTTETKPAEPTMPVKATGEPPEPPPPPKPVETAAKPGAAAPAKPASAQKPSEGTETPAKPKNASEGPSEPGKGTEAQPVVKPVEASGVVRTFKKGQLDQLDDAVLNGVPLKPWTPPKDIKGWQKVEGQMDGLAEPPMFTSGKRGSGVLITEPDGRVWLAKPTGAYGGYQHTFPKGTQEVSEALSLQANAIKEAYEETGLKVRITGFAGDFKGDTGTARYYHAVREGGTPLDHGTESEAVVLVPKKDLDKFLNKQRDKDITAQHLAEDAPPPVKTATPGGTAQTGSTPKPPPNDKNHTFDELVDLPPSKMADEGEKGLIWEYKQEYIKYGGEKWGPGIKDQADFDARYKEAPLTYLNAKQLDNLGYTSINSKKLRSFNQVMGEIGHRRDPKAIRERMFNGVTTPPIVLKKGDSLRLMAGQSRLFTAHASGFNVPVKIIDVTPGVASFKPPPVKLPAYAPPEPATAGKLAKDDVLSFTAQGKTTYHSVADLRQSLSAKQLQERVDSGMYKRAPAGTAPTPKGQSGGSNHVAPPPPPPTVVKKPGETFTEADIDFKSDVTGTGFKQRFLESLNSLPQKFTHAAAALAKPSVHGSMASTTMKPDYQTKINDGKGFAAYFDPETKQIHHFQDKGFSSIEPRVIAHEMGHQFDWAARGGKGGNQPPEFTAMAKKVRDKYISSGAKDEMYYVTDNEMWARGTEHLVLSGFSHPATNSKLHTLMREEGLLDWMKKHYQSRDIL